MIFSKVVYLDEQAIFDFLEIRKKGTQQSITKTITKNALDAEAGGEVKAGLWPGIFTLKLSGSAKHNKTNLVENQISSTLISSFIEYVESDKDKSTITEIVKPTLKIEENSPAYYRNISPVLDVISDINEVSSLSIEDKRNLKGFNISKFKGLLDDVSGYYELIFECEDEETGIVRFNINGLRNNYSLSDLTKMDLTLYGVEVGRTKDLNLEFDKKLDNVKDENEPDTEFSDAQDEEINLNNSQEKYRIIDVIFAGV